MEKLQKDESLEDDLEKFRDYGFNIDDLLNDLNENNDD